MNLGILVCRQRCSQEIYEKNITLEEFLGDVNIS